MASHQNEGGAPASDWTQAEAAGRYPHVSRDGTQFRTRFTEDLDLVAGMGCNAFRTSIEWARLEPTPGTWDPAEVAYLHGLFDAARARGLTVIVTLQHFTSPAWITEGAAPNGWESPRTAEAFVRYARFVAEEFGAAIDYYLTFNEPSNLLLGAYGGAKMPPFRSGPWTMLRAARQIMAAHAAAYEAIHAADPTAKVSLTEFSGLLSLAGISVRWQPGNFLKPLLERAPGPDGRLRFKHLDYYCLHYYGDTNVFDLRHFPTRPDRFGANPDAFVGLLEHAWKTYGLPILIGENGLATRNHEPRHDGIVPAHYMQAHVDAMKAAMRRGVPVIGYLWWTLTDNYEWGSYHSRFGLYRVECQAGDFTRVPTPAVETFKRIIAAGHN